MRDDRVRRRFSIRPATPATGPRRRGCVGKLKVIASIEEPEAIAKILAHLERMVPEQRHVELSLGAGAPPLQASLL